MMRVGASDAHITVSDMQAFVQAHPRACDDKRKGLSYITKIINGDPARAHKRKITPEEVPILEMANLDPKMLYFAVFCKGHATYNALFETSIDGLTPEFTLQTDAYSTWDAASDWAQWRIQRAENVSKFDNGWYRHGIRLLMYYQIYQFTGRKLWELTTTDIEHGETTNQSSISSDDEFQAVQEKATSIASPVDSPCASPMSDVSQYVVRSHPSLAATSLTRPWEPEIPPIDIQENRIPAGNAACIHMLETHTLGDLYENPIQKTIRPETLEQTKERNKRVITSVLTDWALKTPAGKRFLAAADLREGEFQIDHLIARNGDGCPGLNNVENLYFMPARANAHFSNKQSEPKKKYVGKMAWDLTLALHKCFTKDQEMVWSAKRFRKISQRIMSGCEV